MGSQRVLGLTEVSMEAGEDRVDCCLVRLMGRSVDTVGTFTPWWKFFFTTVTVFLRQKAKLIFHVRGCVDVIGFGVHPLVGAWL